MKPKNWNYVRQFHLNPPTKHKYLPRTPEMNQKYDFYKQSIANLGDFLLHRIFNTSEKINLGWQILPNNFPCFLEENIDHLVLWIHPSKNYTLSELGEILQKFLCSQYKEWIFYQNLPHVRSVPQITHYHVFARK